ncbi:accessory gene regulator B family protein [Ureibacillus sp. 179-F W5.1 NHS]|uniref:Acyltransferase n=1 Tax=Lysinibacillus halotolerans TaxID=1368476 RepID=A0A3M8HCR2_9BACI|nr:accessory gene regulator B family protein [Lysinibacillus halotolerans]RND00162.1 hypothetical protein EC501_05160 [Lysinibacillus halotolerans]
MEKHRFKFVIPTMVIVAIGSIFMLRNYFQEVSTRDSVLLVVIATIFSGMIAYLLFPYNNEEKPDPKPESSKKKVSK